MDNCDEISNAFEENKDDGKGREVLKVFEGNGGEILETFKNNKKKIRNT